MTDAMEPVIRQMLDARDDRERAELLLRCPDNILLKYAGPMRAACRQFEAGALFVDWRMAMMCAARSPTGLLPWRLAVDLEMLRSQMAAYAAGGRREYPHGDPPPAD